MMQAINNLTEVIIGTFFVSVPLAIIFSLIIKKKFKFHPALSAILGLISVYLLYGVVAVIFGILNKNSL